MDAVQIVEYESELREEQETVCNRIVDSMKDIEAGTGKEYNEFFDELERKYSHA